MEASGWKAWPPRLADQPIFYPVTNEAYARQIARITPAGKVTEFPLRGTDDVEAIVTGSDHNLWFTEHTHPQIGLYILMSHNRKTDGFIKYEIDLRGARAVPRSPLFEKDGSLVWIGTNDKGLFSYNLKTAETANYLKWWLTEGVE